MSAYTDDDVTAGAVALYDADYIGGMSMTDYERVVEVALAAVAPAIAARALRQAADDHVAEIANAWDGGVPGIRAWLRARADATGTPEATDE